MDSNSNHHRLLSLSSRMAPYAKFIRLFQGIRLNPRSHLTEAEYKKLSVGSLYALQQGAYLNSLTLDIKDKLPTILADWWGHL